MTETAWPRQIRISGGSSETEVKELTVKPVRRALGVHHGGHGDTGGEAAAGAAEFVCGNREALA